VNTAERGLNGKQRENWLRGAKVRLEHLKALHVYLCYALVEDGTVIDYVVRSNSLDHAMDAVYMSRKIEEPRIVEMSGEMLTESDPLYTRAGVGEGSVMEVQHNEHTS
jgi:hypothetical protein